MAPLTVKEAAALTAWACGVLAALLVAIFGTLALALCKGGNAPPTCVETRRCERCESSAGADRCGPAAGCEATDEQNPLPSAIDLTVNMVGVPAGGSDRPGAHTARWTMTQTVTNGVSVAPESGDTENGDREKAGRPGDDQGNGREEKSESGAVGSGDKAPLDPDDGAKGGGTPAGSDCGKDDCRGTMTQSVVVNVPPPPTTAGGSGRDVVVVLDREKTVEKPAGPACRGAKDRCGGEAPRPPCTDGDEPEGGSKPCGKAVKLGHVEFEHGGRRFVPSHPDLIGSILENLGGRTGPLLVVGHGDRCGQRRLAERRAKKARGELRRLLKKRLAWKNGDIRVHSQAAGAGPGALEGRCAAELYRTAGVYLIEDLSR